MKAAQAGLEYLPRTMIYNPLNALGAAARGAARSQQDVSRLVHQAPKSQEGGEVVNPVRFATKASDRGAGSRAEILARVRANQPPNVPLPPPRVYASLVQTHFETFAANLERMGGELIVLAEEADLDDWIRRRYPDAEVVCSGGLRRCSERKRSPACESRRSLRTWTSASCALPLASETGSVLLTEQHLAINALGFLAQHLVVLLDPSAIVPDLHHAYRDPSFTDARYTVLLTGPSATADIEGILVRGAQGARSLAVVARRKQEP